MEPVVLCISVAIVLAIFAVVAYLLKPSKFKVGGENEGAEDAQRANQRVPRPAPRRVGGVRGRQVRNRLAPAQDQNDSDDDEDVLGGDDVDLKQQFDGKVGAKKLRKIQEKAERAAQREAETEERRERQERQEKLEKKRQKEEQIRQKEEAAKAAEEERLKEEQAKRDHEEYLKIKEAFSVDEEGTDVIDEQDAQSLLQEFINYIEEMKVVMLEDLAAHFKIKTQDAVDRVKTLQSEGRLSGVMDDRGKFISITANEYEAVAKFIKQRGRVSINELSESMNRLIRLNATAPVSAPTDVTAVA